MTSSARSLSSVLRDIGDAVESSSSVSVRGLGSQSHMIPAQADGCIEVRVPSGITRIDPGEMVVECLAGTTVAELQHALSGVGQRVNFPEGGTVGGVIATARNSVHRLGRGAMRDAVLRLDVVAASGTAYRCGGNTVKNVSGFDLCRLHTGAFGTLGVLVSVLLRTHPVPRAAQWFATSHDTASRMVGRQWGVTSILSNGAMAYVHCEGHRDDLSEIGRRWGMSHSDGHPSLGRYRWSIDPALVDSHFAPDVYTELGVGIVHEHRPRAAQNVDRVVRELNDRIRREFDPGRKINPHIDPLRVAR